MHRSVLLLVSSFSHLIDQDERYFPGVRDSMGRMHTGHKSKRGEPNQYHNGGAEAHQQGSVSLALWFLIAPRSYPQSPLELLELIIQQDPQHRVVPRFQDSHGWLGT